MAGAAEIAKMLENYVALGEMAGAVTLVFQEGQAPISAQAGWRDMAAQAPMRRDTIFRIASLSKPITSATALAVMETGKFTLDDPISRFAPGFATMRVLARPDGPLEETVPAARAITFRDLLTHRAGLVYGDPQGTPLARAVADALGWAIDSHVPPDDWIGALAALPLAHQPGAVFNYSCATDLLGLLLARIEGKPLEAVMAQYLFGPLGMHDTGFSVPAAKRDRVAAIYGFDDSGKLLARSENPGAFLAERPPEMGYQSGGQGLWSTANDFLAFARLFTGQGMVDGVRVLTPGTLLQMTSNQLTDSQRADATLLGMPVFSGHGFGLGLAVVMDEAKAPAYRCKGPPGTVGWPGAYGGWWQADPAGGKILIFLAHNAPDPVQLAQGIGLGIYGAIMEFHGLGLAALLPAAG